MGEVLACSRETACTWSFVLRIFTCFLKAGTLREILGKDLNRIFNSFPCVLWYADSPKWVYIEGSGLFSGPFHLQQMLPKRDQNPGGSSLASSGMCKPLASKCPWLGKKRPWNLLASYKLLHCLTVSQFLHSTCQGIFLGSYYPTSVTFICM